MKKGTLVTYKAGPYTVAAIVRTRHRDNSCTVEARHFLKRGKPAGCYLGYRYRMPREWLRVA